MSASKIQKYKLRETLISLMAEASRGGTA